MVLYNIGDIKIAMENKKKTVLLLVTCILQMFQISIALFCGKFLCEKFSYHFIKRGLLNFWCGFVSPQLLCVNKEKLKYCMFYALYN